MENNTGYTWILLNNVHDAVKEAFGKSLLSTRQLALVVNLQPKKIIKQLVDTDGDTIALDAMIDNISKSITGMTFPRPGEDAKYKLRFKNSLARNEDRFFKPILNLV